MALPRKPVRKFKVVKSDPTRNKYAMAYDASKFGGSLPQLKTNDVTALRGEHGAGTDEVNEPAATYGRAEPRKRRAKAAKRKGYNARKFTGMLPGIAERMKVYVKHLRDDR
jgi:hypothetical protein